MRPWITAICVALLALQAQASERWNFAPPLAVTGAPAEAVFHHLDGAGIFAMRLDTGGLRFEQLTAQVPGPSLGHLGPAGISGAQVKDSGWQGIFSRSAVWADLFCFIKTG